MFWTILFYAVCAVGALLFVGLLYYRIDWARHPEKYKDLENDEKSEYWEKKKKDQQLRPNHRHRSRMHIFPHGRLSFPHTSQCMRTGRKL